MRRAAVCIALSLLASCGGAAPAAPPHTSSAASQPPPAPSEAAAPGAPEAQADAPQEDLELPSACSKPGDKLCAPSPKFVKRLCGGFFPDVALAMFAKGTPWTRGYLNRNVEAWNASGGAASNDKLEFDEEVLVLFHKKADTQGMQVSGAGDSFDVLRWDGVCASLTEEELTLRPPPKPKAARIPWKNLDLKVREALLANATIGKTDSERRKECKGATMGEVSVKCVKAEAKLSDLVVDYVRSGGALPRPEKLH